MAPSIPVKEPPDEFASELGAASARTLSRFQMHFLPHQVQEKRSTILYSHYSYLKSLTLFLDCLAIILEQMQRIHTS